MNDIEGGRKGSGLMGTLIGFYGYSLQNRTGRRSWGTAQNSN